MVLSNVVLGRKGTVKAHIKSTSELIFDDMSYVAEQKALHNEINSDFMTPQGTFHNRRELDDWLEDSSRLQKAAQTSLNKDHYIRDSESESECDDFDGSLSQMPSGAISGQLQRSTQRSSQSLDTIGGFLEFAADQAQLSDEALGEKYPAWGPNGYVPELDYLRANEGGVEEGSDPKVGTDQPTDDTAHLVNHFEHTGTVSEGELRQHHLYLTQKYESHQFIHHLHDPQGRSNSTTLSEHMVCATDVAKGDDHQVYDDKHVYATAVAKSDEYHKVIDDANVDFSASRDKELEGLMEHTLEAVHLEEAADANVCGTKWVDKVKPDGSLKSRLVVQGFTQVWLKDYHDTFSAVASLTTFRIIVNLAAILGWEIHTIDVSQAYTQGELFETIYIRAPKTHPLPKGMVYKLLRPLYGTKQAGRCWYLHVTKILRSMGLQQATKDRRCFIQMDEHKGKPNLILTVLVGDLLIMAEEECTVTQFHEKFSKVYKVSQFEKIQVYNGIQISRVGKHVYELSQDYEILQFLAKCPIQDFPSSSSLRNRHSVGARSVILRQQ